MVVAPLAVVGALRAVGFGAVQLMAGNRHAAALAEVVHGHVEESLERHVEGHADELDHVDAWHRLSALPARDSLPGHRELAGHLFLRQAGRGTDLRDGVAHGHGCSRY